MFLYYASSKFLKNDAISKKLAFISELFELILSLLLWKRAQNIDLQKGSKTFIDVSFF